MIVKNLCDFTPEVVAACTMSDEQALLAKVRYSRILEDFIGFAAHSHERHSRFAISELDYVEIDETYVAVDSRGRGVVMPVQAKGAHGRLSFERARQDIAVCARMFPELICRAIAAQFLGEDSIALFEVNQSGDELRIADERHYRLFPSG